MIRRVFQLVSKGGILPSQTVLRTLGILITLAATIASAHDGHLNDAPWAACNKQKIGALCAYTNASGDVYRGTCRSMNKHLICVRNKPIEKFKIDEAEEQASTEGSAEDS